MDIAHELETLNSLKEKGIITEEDFQSQKERLLKMNVSSMEDSGASMKEAYISYWKNSFKWCGRAKRSEFWWPVLVNFLISIGLSIVGALMPVVSLVQILFGLACIVPSLAVWVRRYHDLGHSAWFAFIPTFILLGLGIMAVFDFVINYAGGGLPSAFNNIRTATYVVGAFVLIPIGIVWGYVFPCLPGQKEANRYGNPK